MSTVENLICEKCSKQFKRKDHYEKHILNVLNPCDYICIGCNKKCKSRKSFFNHKKKCIKYISASKALEYGTEKITNNITNAPINVSTQNTQNNTNNQVVLMSPFHLDHHNMEPTVMLSPVRDEIIGLLHKCEYAKAYEKLFNHIHGNEKYPQYHNIYLPNIDGEHLAVFKGRNFVFEEVPEKMPILYRVLKAEMKWMVRTCKYLDPQVKDQMLWDVQANWMQINEYKDMNMRRILRNNKNIVTNTFEKYTVKPDSDMIIKQLGFVPKDMNRNHIVKLP